MSQGQANPYPLRLDKELMDKVKKLAEKDARSVNKEIEFILRSYVDNRE